MTDLSKVSTVELMKALGERDDITSSCIDPKTGRTFDFSAFKVRRALGAIVCSDLVPVFEDEYGIVWGGCITRGDQGNPFYCKHAYIGGVIGYGQTIEATMRYHAKIDLDLTVELPLGWQHPVRINQYFPTANGETRDGFLPEWDKHSVAPLHLAFITGDASNPKFGNKSGKQEALGFRIYNLKDCPPASEWAYGQHHGFLEVVQKATELRDKGILALPALPQQALAA